MTESDEFEDLVTTSESLERVVREVLLAAIRNGVDPRGSWTYRNGESAPDLEVVVTELEKRDEP